MNKKREDSTGRNLSWKNQSFTKKTKIMVQKNNDKHMLSFRFQFNTNILDKRSKKYNKKVLQDFIICYLVLNTILFRIISLIKIKSSRKSSKIEVFKY